MTQAKQDGTLLLLPHHPFSGLHPSGLPPHLPHGLGVDEMVVAPDGGVIVVLPL